MEPARLAPFGGARGRPAAPYRTDAVLATTELSGGLLAKDHGPRDTEEQRL
jgi:hypothetical protein